MGPHTEEATWTRLQKDLEQKFSRWGIPYSTGHAAEFVEELRREGWRTPALDYVIHNDTWRRQRPVRTEAAQKHIAACRAAIKSAGKDAQRTDA